MSGADTRHARNSRSRPGPAPGSRHFQLFSHFIIKITSLCAEEGVTQAELIERLIEKEACHRKMM
ncbi:hypothetical protein KEP72_21810 [Escherichia coli]|nr:hypothetical protein [Escherichia coli]